MSVPKYNEMYLALLQCLRDGQAHHLTEICDKIPAMMQLSEADAKERMPDSRYTVLRYRIGWTKTYLARAGLVEIVRRGYYQITDEGKKVFDKGIKPLNNEFLMRYPSFVEFYRPDTKKKDKQQDDLVDAAVEILEETPDAVMENAVRQLNTALADDLLGEIMAQPPGFFEWLVSHLLEKMGYGVSELEHSRTAHQVRDGGIDGVIREDKLGFSKIYIQAKRWDLQTPVGRPEIQKFFGALPMGMPHGLFITTSRFSADAQEYAAERNIVLVDGKKLAQLMIEYDVGVSVEMEYVIKKLDTDFFEDSLA